jgi:AcrR family transcriptional regulator
MPRGEFDRSERRARTRTALLQAAARVYARRGFDGATIDEIAEDAGFTKGAVYDHFGSKENLLFALLDEHLASQIAEQVSLFDPEKESAERPRVGADRWMAELDESPDLFRLFVEAWVHAQRDPELMVRVVAGIHTWRSTLGGFGRERVASEAVAVPEAVLDQVPKLMVALGIGLGMMRLADPDAIPPELLGAASVLLIRALETSEEARAVLADVARRRAS